MPDARHSRNNRITDKVLHYFQILRILRVEVTTLAIFDHVEIDICCFSVVVPGASELILRES